MTVDMSLNLGNILTAIIAIIAFAVAFTQLGGRVDLLKTDMAGRIDMLGQRVGAVEETLKGQGNVTTRVAVLETQNAANAKLIANLSDEMADLRRGRGFVQPRVDGEYP